MTYVLLTLTLVLIANAQECRITAITPAQPAAKVEEGERALESQTFQTAVSAVSPESVVHFFDTASRIRRIEANGRMTTIAGNGVRADTVSPGPARETGLPPVSQILFPPQGTLHFVSVGRVFRIVNGIIEVVAGSGHPGFNGEAGLASEVNLGGIVNVAFTHTGTLLILDGFSRVRRLESDGTLRTIVGSTRAAAAAGFTGDNGPATEASLSGARQIVPLRDGSLWIRDLTGRHLRSVTPDGIIHTINPNFETSANIMMLGDGTPGAAVANRVFPLRPNGTFETGINPFAPFTGTPRAIGPDGTLFFEGSARPEQRNPLVRLPADRVQTVVAGAPVAATVDGQAPPFGIWNPRSNSLLYSASVGGKSGIVELRPGQTPRYVVGGGNDVGEPDGKAATDLAVYGIVAFTVDGEGRIIVADVNRQRILVVGTDGKAMVLKAQGGGPVIYAPLGTLSNLQRIAADNAGDIYWYSQGATPVGGVFTADVSVWTRANSSVSVFAVTGLSGLSRFVDGSAVVIAGNGGNFRTAYNVTPSKQGDPLAGFRMLPLTSVTRWRDQPYFTAASRLFRGEPGVLEMLDVPTLADGASFSPDFALASPENLLVHLSNGGFYRIDNIDSCKWTPQPLIRANGIVNAASYAYPNTTSPRQLLTVFGTGLGPPEGQGMILDGLLRAGGQPAPYPALVLGNFSGAIPNATLTGTALPVIHSNAEQVTVAAMAGIPASGSYLLYYTWQGLQLIHPTPVRVSTTAPGLFTATGKRDGLAAAINEDGSRNSEDNPAAAGSLVRLYGTGFGALDTTLALGDFLSTTTPTRVINPVTVTIGGIAAPVEFAGGAPGQIGGVYEIAVRVPEGLERGPQSVVVETVDPPHPTEQRVVIQVR